VWGLFRAGVPARDLALAVLPSVLRALRVHAPAALDAAVAAGADPALAEHARRLRALPAEVSPRATKAASDAAAAAATESAGWASEAAAAARAAAESARWAARAAADAAGWAERAAGAAGWAADAAAESAGWAAAEEHRRCANEIRAAIPWAVVREADAASAALKVAP
jgi:hypothetical protein